MVQTEYRLDLQRDEIAVAGQDICAPQLSIIIPAQVDASRIASLLATLSAACAGITAEVLAFGVGADSGLWAACERDALRVRTLDWLEIEDGQRSAAMRAGVEAARAPYVAVVAPDFTCSPGLLARLVAVGEAHEADVVIGSRYRSGVPSPSQPLSSRALGSLALRSLTRLLFPECLLHVHDPLSGLLLVRRTLLADLLADMQGWPADAAPGLEALVRAPWTKLIEVPCASEPGPESADDSATGVVPRVQPLARQLARLALMTPTAAAVWKTSLTWLLGSLPAAALLIMLQSLVHLPIWQAALAAIETQALAIAALATLNAEHRTRPAAVAVRWLRSHRMLGLP
ncbi:MAG: glycosyltransferase, partial [Chloroflexota bacterium]|nr:glycosyltransferase [Chloroflexota bacterium]